MSSENKLPEIEGAEGANHAAAEHFEQRQEMGSADSFKDRGNSMQGHIDPNTGKTYFVAKKERQDVDRDAQLLANRIALLKQEEIKTWKKIEETKKRAGEVFKLKQRNNERVQAKAEKMQYDMMVAQQSKQRIDQIRKERNIEKAKIQQSILMSKHEEARQARLKAEQDNLRKEQQMEYINRLNQERKQRIKFDESIAKQKQDEGRIKKINDTRAAIAKQIQEEQMIIQQKEQEVMQMELLEMELIKKLQNTQAIQKQAYMDLESAIQQRSVIGNTAQLMMGGSGYRSAGSRSFKAGIGNNPDGANNNMGENGVRQSNASGLAAEPNTK